MKSKHKANTAPARQRSTTSSGDGRRRETRQQLWLWLAAVFLVMTLLASECAALFPLE